MSKKHPPHASNNPEERLVARATSFSSPYPLPQQLEAFDRFAPGSAKEVLETAKESIQFQEKMQEMALRAQIARDHHMQTTIRWVMILSILGAFLLAFFQRNVGSYVLLFSGLASLVGVFLYSKRKATTPQ